MSIKLLEMNIVIRLTMIMFTLIFVLKVVRYQNSLGWNNMLHYSNIIEIFFIPFERNKK